MVTPAVEPRSTESAVPVTSEARSKAEPDDRLGDLVRLAEPLHRLGRDELGLPLGGQALDHVGADRRGAHAVDPDFGVGDLERVAFVRPTTPNLLAM